MVCEHRPAATEGLTSSTSSDFETKTFLMKDERKMPRAKHERLLGFQRFVSIIRLEKVEFVISSPLIQFFSPLNNLSRSSKHFAKPLNVHFHSSRRIVLCLVAM